MKYPINEIFVSLQGEGYNQGKHVIFLRFAKCNLACPWCDTDYHHGEDMTIDEILYKLQKIDCQSILLTGGEPTIYDLKPLLKRLKKAGYWIGVESNGTHEFNSNRDFIDYITISPKQHYIGQKTNELRVVNTNIGLNQLKHYEEIFDADHYYLSPVEISGKMNILNTMELAGQANAKLTRHWEISIQLHKLANIQ